MLLKPQKELMVLFVMESRLGKQKQNYQLARNQKEKKRKKKKKGNLGDYTNHLIYLFVYYFRASYGTTKYCTYFLRNMPCPNPNCMYLHETGDEADSYNKENPTVG